MKDVVNFDGSACEYNVDVVGKTPGARWHDPAVWGRADTREVCVSGADAGSSELASDGG